MKIYREYYDSEYRNKMHKYYNDKINADTMRYQKKYGFELNPQKGHETWNVEADAFKHAYGSALMSLEKDNIYSKLAGWQHEKATPNNPSDENKMDTHNNKIGREVANDIRNQYGKKWESMSREQKENIIAEKVWNNMQVGRIILDPSGRTILKNNSSDVQNIKSAPKPAWDKHGNLTGMAADINDLGSVVNEDKNEVISPASQGNQSSQELLPLSPKRESDGVYGDKDFKTTTFDVLKKDSPYINNINSINLSEQNKNTLSPSIKQKNNTFTPTPTFDDLLKKSSALNNNVSIDNEDQIAKNSTFGGVDNGFLNKIKGKRFQDLSDEERLKALWHFVG